MERLRILIVSGNFLPEVTGIGKYNGEMAEWLVRRGHQVQVVTLPPHYPEWRVHEEYRRHLYRKEMRNHVTIYRCPAWIPRNPRGVLRVVFLITFAITSAPVILWRTLFWRPDVVFVTEPPLTCAPVTLLAAKLANVYCWLHVQDFEVDAAIQLGQLRGSFVRRATESLERYLMRSFDHVSTISRNMLGRLEHKGVPVDRCSLFPNWVDTGSIRVRDSTSEARPRFGLPANKIIFMYSGNMGRKQGLGIIVEAARAVQRDDRILFILAGAGSALNDLQELAHDLDNVCFKPLIPTDQYGDFLSVADVHLLPQRADVEDLVLPSKLTSMLASGRPVIATARENSELAAVCEAAGVVVEPGNLEEFVLAIVRLAESPERRNILGKAARQYAEHEIEKEKVLSAVWGKSLQCWRS